MSSPSQDRRKEEEKRRREQQTHQREEQRKKRQEALKEQKKKMRLRMQQLKKQRALLRKQKRSQALAKDGGFLGRMMGRLFKKFKNPTAQPSTSSAPLSAEDKNRLAIELAKKDLMSQFVDPRQGGSQTPTPKENGETWEDPYRV